MITTRPIEGSDCALLEQSLSADNQHTDTSVDFFFDPRSMCNVYEDEHGPVMFVRGVKSLRLDIQFVCNEDTDRNAMAMLGDFQRFSEQARDNGFTEIVFSTNSRGLRAFCKRRFGFQDVQGELRKLL